MQMKLYTREQMIEAFNYGKTLEGFDWIGDMIDSVTPIELPSEEEIEKIFAKKLIPPTHNQGFKLGVEWVIEQIKQQGNGK